MRMFFAILAVFTVFFTSVCYAADPVKAITEMFGNEGGLNCRADDQGNIMPDGSIRCTNFGVAPRSYPNIDTRHLTPEKAVKLVYGPMFKKMGLDKVKSQIIANEAMDGGTNMGDVFEIKLMQTAVNLSNGNKKDIPVDGIAGPGFIKAVNEVPGVVLYINMIGLRYDRYRFLATNNPKKYQRDFNEWLLRVSRNVRKAVHQYEAAKK